MTKSQRVTLALGQQRATRVSVSPCPPPSTGTYCAVIPIARRRTSTSERLTRKKEHPQTPTRDRYSMFRRVGLLTRVRVLPYPCQHQYQYHTSRVRRAVSTYVRINVGLGPRLGRPRINVKLARAAYAAASYHTYRTRTIPSIYAANFLDNRLNELPFPSNSAGEAKDQRCCCCYSKTSLDYVYEYISSRHRTAS